ncbi:MULTISPECIES: cytochrome c biogenesis protein CcsA [unclassified Roseivirga]|uniref:cytochrome c biogenesis protein CcsA n=1 Tax=unclassified Roseivirga TaxID=2626142 RepID=UPI00257D5632|nr:MULTISPECIES: cytochrome c biogenesis protein CcsA [unclassified Roseivirga]MEC7755989.1 cytochrome c biogenesis protein CcsA [Bacteroidota bacterium]
MKKKWWKVLCIVLLIYSILGALLFDAPRLAILNETIRNLHFHVTMWFAMIILLVTSAIYAIKYLRSNRIDHDTLSAEFANAGVLFGILGIVTGAIWANFTWGEPWSGDAKQNSSAIALLIYLAYLVLRNSLEDQQQKARVSAIYNVFAFAALIPLLFILPRMTDSSLHPGNGGNPGFNAYDLDSRLRMVFYPAILGWTLLGVWLVSLRVRIKRIKMALED